MILHFAMLAGFDRIGIGKDMIHLGWTGVKKSNPNPPNVCWVY
jgi:hypothetical protein